jgi:hypothetical protein
MTLAKINLRAIVDSGDAMQALVTVLSILACFYELDLPRRARACA